MNSKLNYDDVTIVPGVITYINSRSECNCFDEYGFLPIFASCMSSVVSMDNIEKFNENKIYGVIPRTYALNERINYVLMNVYNFVAFSLDETIDVFLNNVPDNVRVTFKIFGDIRICIDLANGHMNKLLETVKKLKDKWGDKIVIMTGNIANPETYREYEKAGVDYARFSIGSGNCCITSSQTGIHYPVFSLIQEAYKIKQEINGKCKIIADGGIRGYRDIQKALIYADYVMIGTLFNQAMESAGKTTYGKSYFNIRGYKIFRPLKTLFTYGKEIPLNKYEESYKLCKENKLTIWKEIYGMASKRAQEVMNKINGKKTNKLKTSEGIVKYQKVEFNIKGWAENECDYLKSAMSYTNSQNLEEYKNSNWIQITDIKYNK